MATLLELEGTWDEIVAQLPEFNGQRLRVIVQPLDVQPPREPGPVDAALEQIWKEVPATSWERLPSDLSDNLDHYLYGTPRR